MKRSCLLLAIGFAGLFVTESAVCEEGPQAKVRSVLEAVMKVQNDPALQGKQMRKERKAKIKQIIGESFDFETMSKESLNSYWAKIPRDLKAEFREIFGDIFQDHYTRLVLNFLKKERIDYLSEDVKDHQAYVRTKILRPNEHIMVDYKLREENGHWLITDAIIDDVSIVANYRRQFSRIIRTKSFAVLMDKLRLQHRVVMGE